MKAVGAGTALSALGSATVVGQSDDDDDDGDDDDDTGTVHRVRTLISGPPTDPQRPADFFYQPTGLHVQPGDVVQFVFATPDHNVVGYHPAFGMRRRVPVGVEAFSSPLLGWDPASIPGDMVDPPAEMGGENGHDGGDGDDGSDGDDGGSGDDDGSDGDDGGSGDDDGDDDGDGGNGDDRPGPVPDSWLVVFETPGVYDLLCSPHETYGMAMRVVVGDVTEAPFETSDPSALPGPRVGPVGLARRTLTDPALQPANVVEQGSVPWEALGDGSDGDDSGESGDDGSDAESSGR
jgi:plastocyanin